MPIWDDEVLCVRAKPKVGNIGQALRRYGRIVRGDFRIFRPTLQLLEEHFLYR